MQPLPPRQTDILDHARRDGRVEVDSLAALFDVTPQTIRRDLNELCQEGRLHRVHGGAVYPTGVRNYGYEPRRELAADAKRLIGARAAELIPDNSSVILNIGTTTEQVAEALGRHAGLLVVTNNINVANILRSSEDVEVIIAGGVVRPADGGIVGEATVDFVRQFKVDYAVIGSSGIDEDGMILDYDYREVRVSQEIIRNARRTILVSDRMKFDRKPPVRIAHLEEVDFLVTDEVPPDPIPEICVRSEVRLEIARGVSSAQTERERAPDDRFHDRIGGHRAVNS